MSHENKQKSARTAPVDKDGEVVHLRNTLQASERAFQNDLGIKPPYDWEYCVVLFDRPEDTWKKLQTFDTFEAADDAFIEEVENQVDEKVAGRFKAGKPINHSNGNYPARTQ